MIEPLVRVGTFLLEHADLVEEIAAAITAGASKDAIREAIRAAKVAVSDRALKEELGLGQQR